MNFQELLQKMTALDQPVNETNIKEETVEECGMGPMEPMKQQDNVTMNISMNGSGAGGIRDLLDILKNLDHDDDEAGLDSLIKGMGDEPMGDKPMGKVAVIGDDMPIDELANEPDEMYATVGDVIPTGNDLHSHGGNEVDKVNGGGNPYTNVDEEALIAKLASLYESIKTR